MGVHKNTLGRYERGETSVNGDFLKALAGAGYNTNWILTGKGHAELSEQTLAEKFDLNTLKRAIITLEKGLETSNRTATIEDRAYLISLIYELLLEDSNEDSGKSSKSDAVLKLLKFGA